MPTSPRRQHGERVVADIESRNPAVDPGTPRCRRPVSSALFPTIPVRGRAGTGQPQRRSGRSPTPRRRHRREAGRTSGPAVSGRAHRSGSGCSRCAVRPRSRPHQERGEPPPGTAAGVRVRPSRGAAHRGHRPVRDVQVRAGSDGLRRAVHPPPPPRPKSDRHGTERAADAVAAVRRRAVRNPAGWVVRAPRPRTRPRPPRRTAAGHARPGRRGSRARAGRRSTRAAGMGQAGSRPRVAASAW